MFDFVGSVSVCSKSVGDLVGFSALALADMYLAIVDFWCREGPANGDGVILFVLSPFLLKVLGIYSYNPVLSVVTSMYPYK